MVSMVRDTDGANDSRFFFTLAPDAGWADGRYVAFGRVTEGLDILRKIDGAKVSGPANRPVARITIEDCGVLSGAGD
ncbi:unnamed protein product [Phaeothamnion confervicola]